MILRLPCHGRVHGRPRPRIPHDAQELSLGSHCESPLRTIHRHLQHAPLVVPVPGVVPPGRGTGGERRARGTAVPVPPVGVGVQHRELVVVVGTMRVVHIPALAGNTDLMVSSSINADNELDHASPILADWRVGPRSAPMAPVVLVPHLSAGLHFGATSDAGPLGHGLLPRPPSVDNVVNMVLGLTSSRGIHCLPGARIPHLSEELTLRADSESPCRTIDGHLQIPSLVVTVPSSSPPRACSRRKRWATGSSMPVPAVRVGVQESILVVMPRMVRVVQIPALRRDADLVIGSSDDLHCELLDATATSAHWATRADSTPMTSVALMPPLSTVGDSSMV
mmetsp:Transcript_81663/g.218504  ORF Transcript_81663/g.218504 Transcript_81663/m.218504 type:complete len:337 (+) Transcript_81663:5034-6044(+)